MKGPTFLAKSKLYFLLYLCGALWLLAIAFRMMRENLQGLEHNQSSLKPEESSADQEVLLEPGEFLQGTTRSLDCLSTYKFKSTACGCMRLHNPTETKMNTTCGTTALQRGSGQRVVSFSFFGGRHDIRGYFQGIEGNALSMPEFYPGWTMRVYHNISREDKEAQDILCRMECRFPYLDFCQTAHIPLYGNLANWTAAAWRFLPMADPQVDVFVSRDLDSRFLEREVAAVQEWIQSQKTWHIMRDHPSMVILKMLAGMWGANLQYKREFLRDLMEDILQMPVQHYYGRDQDILAERIWPLVHGDSVRHESYDCLQVPTPDVHPWPTRREDKPYNYVGVRQRVDPIPLRDPCPQECRPQDHPDWLSC